jgi:spermidine/putrescine transport system permease protein
MIPFWTNFLVRTYAWMFILRTEGLLNTLLLGLGVITTPLDLLYTDRAVLIGLVYGYLPFMVLPLYATLERLDPALVEAARDLYANQWSVFWRVIVPLAKPGIIAGCLLVFIPSLGAFLTPDLLGGARNMMVGNLIQHEYLVVRDWPLGSAISLMLLVIVIAAAAAYFFVESRMSRKGVES